VGDVCSSRELEQSSRKCVITTQLKKCYVTDICKELQKQKTKIRIEVKQQLLLWGPEGTFQRTSSLNESGRISETIR
jgi:hypothetical protein